MTTVNFKLRTLEGAPIANTWFRIEPGYQDAVVGQPAADLPKPVEFVTDAAGDASILVQASDAPYFLTKAYPGAADPVAYKLFVPNSAVPLDFNVLLVDLGTHLRFKNDKSLAALIDTKVVVLNALAQAQSLAQVNNTLVARIAALEAKVTAAGL